MSISKKHHFIPACYLRGFTNGGKRTSLFWAFSANELGKKHGANPNDSCVKNNYYKLENSHDLLFIEKWYANVVEPKIGEFLNEVNNLKKIDVQNEGFIWLLSSLALRNPQHREMIEAPLIHAERVAKSMQADYKNKRINLNIAGAEFYKDDIIEYELQQTKILSLYLPFYNYCILKAPAGINVITSDAPMIFANQYQKVFGVASQGTMIIAPLNKTTYLVGSKEIQLPVFRNGTAWEIANLNTIVMAAANEKVYSNEEHIYILDGTNRIIKYPS